jgi:hypothetical protein
MQRLQAAILKDTDCKVRGKSGLGPRVLSRGCWNALSPFCSFGLNELKRRTGARRWRLLAKTGRCNLADHLAERLAFALEPTVKVISNAEVVLWDDGSSGPRKKSDRELSRIFSGALMSFPSLAELISLVLTDWIVAQHELLSRVESDSRYLEQFLAASMPIGRIERLQPGLSDPHRFGRTVTKIEFRNGRKIIYRPRACTGEKLWSQIIAWLNGAGFMPVLRTQSILSRNTYSWTHFLSTRPCRSLAEIRHFYIRWGAQSALARIFGLADLHQENWVAAGSHPILLDVEMFGRDASKLQRVDLNVPSLHPLLATGLLPFRQRNGSRYRGAAPFDLAESFSSKPRCWPRYRQKSYGPADFSTEILYGFASMIEFIWGQTARIKQTRSFLKRSDSMKRRVLIRSTQEYWSLLGESLRPQFMFSLKSRYPLLFRSCRSGAPSRKLAAAEARSLVRCSIPHFFVSPKRLRARMPTEGEMWGSYSLLQRQLATLFGTKGLPEWIRARIS